ncbi:maleate cis-trans isomerase family protein [Bradyrhizobium sp. 5.13L]
MSKKSALAPEAAPNSSVGPSLVIANTPDDRTISAVDDASLPDVSTESHYNAQQYAVAWKRRLNMFDEQHTRRLGFLWPGAPGGAVADLTSLVRSLFPDGSVVAEIAHTTMGDGKRVRGRETRSTEVETKLTRSASSLDDIAGGWTLEVAVDTGARDRLRDGAAALRARGAEVAVWACTSGSFVFGLDGARRQAAELGEDVAAPASSTSLGIVAALDALAVDEVAVAAPYLQEITQHLLDLLEDAGHRVVNWKCLNMTTGFNKLTHDDVLDLIRASDHPRAQAIVVPDTALHTVGALERFEAAVGKPVLTANQVTVWEALRLADAIPSRSGLGTLFAA